MIIDTIDLSDLPDNVEDAFVVFEERLRRGLETARMNDRRENSDNDGYYRGTYSPERFYVSSVLAFLDENNLDIDVTDISRAEENFKTHFDHFFGNINYARTRFALRKKRIANGTAGTPIVVGQDFKTEIHSNLETIRKIVNQNVTNENKKEAIFSKIASLQYEVSSDRTTVDALFARAIDLSEVLGEMGEKLEPAVQKLERVCAALYRGTKRVDLLPVKERPKLLPKAKDETNKPSKMDDEIPF